MTLDPKAVPDARLQFVQQHVHELNKDAHPIICGPFTSELGFEALYWIPLLVWLKARVQGFDERAVILTRGGAGALYGHVAKRAVDIYSLRSVTEVRRAGIKAQRRSGLQKQVEVTEFDRGLIQSAAHAVGARLPYHVLHPSLMYWACAPFMDETAGFNYLKSLCDFATIPAPEPPLPINGLPDKFVAVKFYARHTFPYPHGDVAEFVKRTVATIAAQAPVVVLESADAYDDHTDIPIVGPNISTIGAKAEAAHNLQLQAAIVAKATAFVGTYGGMAQLALRMGRPSVSFYHEWKGIGHSHFALNSWLSKASGVPFLTANLGDFHLWGQLTGLPAPKPAQAMVTA